MLGEGRRRRDRGTDVVVGVVETHGRAQTLAQMGDLEVVPRAAVEYRGAAFEEMDVDALLARKPEVALVDELAHTNVPGSRNEKRWQDVEELLDAGITVISTLNIQHLESLNDVVERITGITQRETIPDEIARRADQIELVDMSPEALRRRMAHGNVYPAERVDAALGNYFRAGNLGALRELALLWVADRVDEALDEYRRDHGIERPWETRERVLVALTGAADGDRLVRRAARMAQRTKGDLVAVHVRSQDGLTVEASDALAHGSGRWSSAWAGTYRDVVGDDVGKALVGTARRMNATQIVLGATRRSRLTELLRGSVIRRVIRDSGEEIDVHVISHARGATETPGHRRPTSLPGHRVVAGALLAAVALPAPHGGPGCAQGRPRPAQRAAPLPPRGGRRRGGRRPLAGARRRDRGLPRCELVLHASPLHVHDRRGREPARARDLPRRRRDRERASSPIAARRANEGQRARAEAETLARLAGTSSVVEILESIRRTFALDGVTLWHRDDRDWVVDEEVGAHAERGEEPLRWTRATRSRSSALPSRTTSAGCSTRS